MKPICVFGVLLTEEGKKIKSEMLEWLDQFYEVTIVEQEPPGDKFEYPAIKRAAELSVEKNSPVLYIHTKGAANKVPGWSARMLNKKFKVPSTAKPEDCQKTIRNMWKNEFTGKRLEEYLNRCNTDKPTVCCPYTGKEKITWFNAWIINPSAAKYVLKNIRVDNWRWYYERIFGNIKEVNVIGMRLNDLLLATFDQTEKVWNDIWSFYEK